MNGTIDTHIRRFLKTRATPRHLSGEAAEEDMKRQIIDTVSARAPKDGDITAWIGQVIEKAMITQKGNAWPSVDVWAAAVGHANGARVASELPKNDLSATEYSFRISCERIAKGQTGVSEQFVFSRQAERGLREARFTLEKLRDYQRAFLAQRAKTYSKEAARRWLEANHPNIAAALDAEREAKKAAVRSPVSDGDEAELIE